MELLLPDDEDFDHGRGQYELKSPTKRDCVIEEKSGVVSAEKTGKTLRYENENGKNDNEDARHDGDVEEDYSKMSYSTVPDGYESIFTVPNEKGRALDTRRKHVRKLLDADVNDDDEYQNSSEEDLQMAYQMLAEKRKATKKRKKEEEKANKVLGKKGEKRIKRKGAKRSSD